MTGQRPGQYAEEVRWRYESYDALRAFSERYAEKLRRRHRAYDRLLALITKKDATDDDDAEIEGLLSTLSAGEVACFLIEHMRAKRPGARFVGPFGRKEPVRQTAKRWVTDRLGQRKSKHRKETGKPRVESKLTIKWIKELIGEAAQKFPAASRPLTVGEFHRDHHNRKPIARDKLIPVD